jgi:hypothetical protein
MNPYKEILEIYSFEVNELTREYMKFLVKGENKKIIFDYDNAKEKLSSIKYMANNLPDIIFKKAKDALEECEPLMQKLKEGKSESDLVFLASSAASVVKYCELLSEAKAIKSNS